MPALRPNANEPSWLTPALTLTELIKSRTHWEGVDVAEDDCVMEGVADCVLDCVPVPDIV